MHWATSLIGAQWSPCGDGPEVFSCWGLVRHVFRSRYGVALPVVTVANPDEDNVRAIKQVVQVSGLHRVDGPVQEGDILIMRSKVELHCGVAVVANGALGVLHSQRNGGVRFEPLGYATAGTTVELWRRIK